MPTQYDDLFRKAYSAFNNRDINTALSTMHAAVQWPRAFEGGYVTGHSQVAEYWTRQWAEIDPRVEPLSIRQRPDGSWKVSVHQRVRDLQGNTLFDGMVKHIYTLEDGLLRSMDIEPG